MADALTDRFADSLDSAAAIARAVREGAVSPVAVVESTLERVERVNPFQR